MNELAADGMGAGVDGSKVGQEEPFVNLMNLVNLGTDGTFPIFCQPPMRPQRPQTTETIRKILSTRFAGNNPHLAHNSPMIGDQTKTVPSRLVPLCPWSPSFWSLIPGPWSLLLTPPPLPVL